MKTISLRMTEPVQTRDERFDAFDAADALGEIVSDLESIGLLEPIDLARVKAILQKYTGASSTTNQLGGSRAGDAADATADAARKSAAAAARNIEHNQSVAAGYKTFWDKNLAENRASIRR
jgi:hypothetical protein